jgi:hypothetical protein
MGWNDELEAYLRTLGQKPGSYKTERDRIRALQDKYAEANPYTSAGLNMAGGIAPFFIPGVGPVLAGGRGAATAARLAAAGAGVGALTGAGEAKEVSDIPEEAATQAAIYAALGAGVKLPGTVKKAAAFRGKAAEKALYDLLQKYAGS